MEWYWVYLIVHLVCALVSISTCLFTQRYLEVKDFLAAIIFGPLSTIFYFSALDAIVIDLRKMDR